MKTPIVIILFLLFLIAIAEHSPKSIAGTIQVICDKGFKTPPSYQAVIHRGVIVWRVVSGGQVYERKMLSGETCYTKSK